jgi:hypothetical protein
MNGFCGTAGEVIGFAIAGAPTKVGLSSGGGIDGIGIESAAVAATIANAAIATVTDAMIALRRRLE